MEFKIEQRLLGYIVQNLFNPHLLFLSLDGG
jgi:hypothetical protein